MRSLKAGRPVAQMDWPSDEGMGNAGNPRDWFLASITKCQAIVLSTSIK